MGATNTVEGLDYLLPKTELIVIGAKKYELGPLPLKAWKTLLEAISMILQIVTAKVDPKMDREDANVVMMDKIVKYLSDNISLILAAALGKVDGINKDMIEDEITLPQILHITNVIWEQNFKDIGKNAKGLLEKVKGAFRSSKQLRESVTSTVGPQRT